MSRHFKDLRIEHGCPIPAANDRHPAKWRRELTRPSPVAASMRVRRGAAALLVEAHMTREEYKERVAALKSRYRYLFAGDHLGHDIAPGWVAIVEGLCAQIDDALAGTEKPAVRFVQIKEKFGGLRAYLNVAPLRVDVFGADGERLSGHLGHGAVPDIFSRLAPFVRDAEEKSLRTCDTCGAPGRLRTDRDWFRTLCEAHASADARDPDNEFT
jgi:hypothetical protein